MNIDPVILFFGLGLFAGVVRADIRLPSALYESISLFLLLTIGLKGGLELAKTPIFGLVLPVFLVVLIGVLQTVLGFWVLRYAIRLTTFDSAAVAAHYGSVSVGTYAVVTSYLTSRQINYEPYLPVFVVALEIPAIIVGVLLARGLNLRQTNFGKMAHELLLGKGVVLLVGGLVIGWIAGPVRFTPYKDFFFGGFKGVLALFLLEMGLICAARLSELRSKGIGLITFALAMPVFGAFVGTIVGTLLGWSVGGTAVLATLLASASYIAVPAAFRMMVPEANPTLSLGAALGVSFPFNVTVGIPLYVGFAEYFRKVVS